MSWLWVSSKQRLTGASWMVRLMRSTCPWVQGWLGLVSRWRSMNETEPAEGVATEARGWPLPVLRQIGALDAVAGEHGLDAIWNLFRRALQDCGGRLHIGFCTSSTTANFEVRSMATNRGSLPSAVCTPARSAPKKPIAFGAICGAGEERSRSWNGPKLPSCRPSASPSDPEQGTSPDCEIWPHSPLKAKNNSLTSSSVHFTATRTTFAS